MEILVAIAVLAGAAFWYSSVLRRRAQLEKIVKAFGDYLHPKTVDALIKEGDKGELAQDGLWIQDHLKQLNERFRGQWIAVVRKEVVAIGGDADLAWKAAMAAHPARAPFVRRIV
jgi:hypothetical protein